MILKYPKNITTRCLIIASLLLFYNYSFSQVSVKGKVVDQTTLEPIVGAVVTTTINQYELVTDANGIFETSYSPEIKILANGYINKIIHLKPTETFLNIVLEASSYDLQEIVITANTAGKEKLRESSASVGFISTRDLTRDNQTIITNALNRIPGVYMHSGTFNTSRITIRGIGSRSIYSTNKVRAYLNEIPLTTGTGETTIEDIDMSLVDRVEIIKGPSSSLYGAGLGGTILLHTKKADYRKTNIFQNNSFGQFGLFRNTSGFRSSSGKANLNLVYNKTYSNGYRENNEFDRSNLMAMGDFFANEKHVFSFLTNYIKLKAFIPSSIDSATFTDNPKAAAASWANTKGFEEYDKILIGFTHQADFQSNLKLHTSLFSGFRNSYELRPFNILKENTQNVGIRSHLAFHPELESIKSGLVLGGEYFTDWYQWKTYENVNRETGLNLSDNKETRRYFNLFFQSRFEFVKQFIVNAGINLNQTFYEYLDYFIENGDQSGNYSFNLIVSPRLSLSYRFKNQSFVYANISHGFSPPGLEETLTPEGIINPNIQPETGWNIEAGTRGNLLNNKLYYDVSLYTMQIKNLLVARRTSDDQFVGLNAGKTEHNGVEILLSYLVKNSETITIQLFTNSTLAFYKFREFTDGDNNYSGNILTGTPKSTVNAGMDISSKVGFYGNLNFQFVDKMPITDDNSIFSDAYSIVNLKAGYKKLIMKHIEVDFFAGINNLFDEKYASMLLINAPSAGGNTPRYYYPGLPVNYFGGFTLGYFF